MKELQKRLINITNHTLIDSQILDAKSALKVTEIVNLPEDLKKIWSQVPANISTEQVKTHIKPILQWLHELCYCDEHHMANYDYFNYIICAGSRSACCYIDFFAYNKGCAVVESCTERKSVEKIMPDGTVTKTAIFEHLQWREIPRYNPREEY